MTTSALSGLDASLYRDDPDAANVAFSNLSLVDSGDHLTYQAAKGYRYWDRNHAAVIEKQVHGSGGWTAITTSCTINYLQGKITVSAALNSDDLVRATGERRAEASFVKMLNMYDAKLKIDGKEVDTTSIEDDGFGSSLASFKSWQLDSGAFFYPTEANFDLMAEELICKIYSFNRKGYHTSGASPSTNISAGSDTKFKIQADSEASATEVTLSVSGKNTGALIAAEMQSKIRAIGGAYAAVTVEYSFAGLYVITSGTRGSSSKIRITNGDTNNVADNLKIGTGNGGTDTDGVSYGFIGIGTLQADSILIADPNNAQKEQITFKGKGEIYVES